jgi:hypothetical protein
MKGLTTDMGLFSSGDYQWTIDNAPGIIRTYKKHAREYRKEGDSDSAKVAMRQAREWTNQLRRARSEKKQKRNPSMASLAKGIKAKWVQIKRVNGRYKVKIKK